MVNVKSVKLVSNANWLPDTVGVFSQILNQVLPRPALVELAEGEAVDRYAEKYYGTLSLRKR